MVHVSRLWLWILALPITFVIILTVASAGTLNIMWRLLASYNATENTNNSNNDGRWSY